MGKEQYVEQKPVTFDEQLRNSVRLINVYVGVSLAVLIVVSVTINLLGIEKAGANAPLHIPNGTWRLIFLFVLQLVAYTLNRKYPYTVTATLTYSSFLLCIIAYPLLPVKTYPPEDLVVLLITTIPLSLVNYMVFNIARDHGQIIFWQLSSLLVYVFAMGHTLIALESDYPGHFLLDVFMKDPIILLGHLGVLIFLNLIFYTYRRSYFAQHQQLWEVNQKLEQRMTELSEQRNLLQRYRNELVNLQAKLRQQNESLEEEVALRTKKLAAQNKTLMQYGFLNSRLVRTPIIKLKEILSRLEGSHYNELLANSKEIEDIVSDLDDITLTIGQVLSDMQLETVEVLRDRLESKYTVL